MTSILTRRAVAPATAYCKVDDSSGPIIPGDQLTPSTTTFGHAMKAGGPGDNSAVIGEALEPFDGGCGLIRIAVTGEQATVMRKQIARTNRRRNPIYRLLNHS